MSETSNSKTGGTTSADTSSENRKQGLRTETGNTSRKQSEEISKSNLVVEAPEFVPIAIDGKSEEAPKPKRKYKKREKKTDKKETTDIKDVQMLIEGIFTVVSLKGGEHWKLQSKESEQIAIPLTNILEKNNLIEKVGNVSDGMGLIIACISIVVPRLLISKMQKPNKTREVLEKNGAVRSNTGVTGDAGKKDNKGNNIGESRENVAVSTKRNESVNNEFINTISPPIYC